MSSKFSDGGQRPSENVGNLTEAVDALKIAPSYDVREGSHFIDEVDVQNLPVSSGSDDEEEQEEDNDNNEDDQSSGYDSQLEAAAWDESMTRVDDEDWEIAEGGAFTLCTRVCLSYIAYC